MKEIKLYIDGEFLHSSTNTTFSSIDPSSGEKVALVHLPSVSDLENAIKAAHKAFYSKEWRAYEKKDRAALLLRISEKIKERKNELIEFEVKDSGSTIRKAKADIHNASSYFKVLADELMRFEFTKIDEKATRADFSKNFRIYEPVGVCAQIIPWNFPLVMAAWKLGPILASGCTTVLKSADETPVTAGILAEIIHESGVPRGVINIITGGAKEGEYLVKHPLVRKVAFTGSTQVGKLIMQEASTQLKNISLELGGKSANIILDDADLSIAVDGALYAFLYHSGQACDSGTRLLVDQKIYPEFKKLFLDRISQIKVGLTSEPASSYGPVINQKQADRILNYIEISKNEGAKCLFGGKRLANPELKNGYFIEPTVFEVTPQNTIFKEEIFGPVVAITTFSSEEEAISLANNSTYGLAAAVWSKNQDKALNLAKRLEAGTVWINEYHLLNPGMPFGGYKESGIGREMGEEGLKSYLEVKHLWVSDCDHREKKVWYDALF